MFSLTYRNCPHVYIIVSWNWCWKNVVYCTKLFTKQFMCFNCWNM